MTQLFRFAPLWLTRWGAPCTRSARRWHFAGLLVLTLGLTGCSAVKLTYQNLDTLILFWLNRYVALDGSQETWAKERITQYLQWHRQTQLPLYVTQLESLQLQLQQGDVKLADARRLNQTLRQFGVTLLEQALPDLVELSFRLRPEQLTQLEQRFQKDNKTYRQTFLAPPPAERLQARAEKMLDRIGWLVDLNRSQAQEIRQLTAQYPVNLFTPLEERQARQQEVLDLLRQVQQGNLDREQTKQRLHHLFQAVPLLSQDEGRRNILRDNVEKNLLITQATLALLTPEQRQQSAKKLANWARDLRDLQREGQGATR
ncbi:hypothetical protein DU000_10715 [Parvibium lacunae]|uniref:Lipoprotein n=2 Tax=Parvibium lacunae TaxID=1888893 RepID=A0A368L088_9BURK|nr:hypothetical protein DU000_10715 [Parvibium lacunae]